MARVRLARDARGVKETDAKGGGSMYSTTRIAAPLVAVFIALAGSAYAVDGPLAGQNTVGSEDIIDGEVKSADVANGSVQTADIKNDDVRSSDVRDDSLTGADVASGSIGGEDIGDNTLSGADIVEATLSPVPFAHRASEVVGVTFRGISFRGERGAHREVLNLGGLTLTADCNINGYLNVVATASGTGIVASYSTSTTDTDETAMNEMYRVTPGSGPVYLLGGGRRDDQMGHTIFHAASGDVVSVDWLADNAGLSTCDFVGTATQH
jgi:uncharacterized protein YjbI with pentapeptide repeats